jgi:dephospho-CoA kinase
MKRSTLISASLASRRLLTDRENMLIGLTGLAGAGKSTAIAHLESGGIGTCYYAGSVLREEIMRRGLGQTPDNERTVREELRKAFGMAVFAERALAHLLVRCGGQTTLLDAIYCFEEYDCYRAHFGAGLVLIAVTASPVIRHARLASRPDRPIASAKAYDRDRFELTKLRIGQVIDAADHTIENESSLEEFKQALDVLACRLS